MNAITIGNKPVHINCISCYILDYVISINTIVIGLNQEIKMQIIVVFAIKFVVI